MALQKLDIPAWPAGMCVSAEAFAINPNQAVLLQDVLVDQAGLARRRGPLVAHSGAAALSSRRCIGITGGYDPSGTYHVATVEGDSEQAYLVVLPSDLSARVEIPLNVSDPNLRCSFQDVAAEPLQFPDGSEWIFDARPALGGGMLIGISDHYGEHSNNMVLVYWRGADLGPHLGSGGSLTLNVNDATVTGSGVDWSNWCPGMFLFCEANQSPFTDHAALDPADHKRLYVGCVKSVDPGSNTALLDRPSLITTSAETNWFLTPVRGINPRVTNGTITCTTKNGGIDGGATTFRDENMDNGNAWAFYRGSDWHFIGLVNSYSGEVTNIKVHLIPSTTPAFNMDDEAYYALMLNGNYELGLNVTVDQSAKRKVGFLTTPYQQQQLFANVSRFDDRKNMHSRVWESEIGDFESLPVSGRTGNFFDIASTDRNAPNLPITGIAATLAGRLIWKQNETFLVSGDAPNLNVRRVLDDGCLSAMTIQPYGNGYIWAGRRGIWYYDGVTATLLTDQTFGQRWTDLVQDFDPEQHGLWAMIVQGHYLIYDPVGGPLFIDRPELSELILCLRLADGAPTVFTNLRLKGGVQLPPEFGSRTLIVVDTATGSAICDSEQLFAESGNDTVTCDGATPGPHLHVVSPLYAFGDPELKKLIKQLQGQILCQGGTLTVRTIAGPEASPVDTSDPWPESTIFVHRRKRFLKRATVFGFELEENAGVTKVEIGPMALQWKPQSIQNL